MRKVLLCFILLLLPLSALADLQLHFLDVGQGDCTIVVCDGESMIIDGGPESESRVVCSYIRDTLGLTHVDYLVATHPHEDHIGGLADVLNTVPVDMLYSPVSEWDSSWFQKMKESAQAQGTQIEIPNDGDTLPLGGATVTVLHCWPDAGTFTTINDASIVTRIDYGDTAFLITGDAEYTAELMMVDSGLPLKADVLRIAHHGSDTSTTQEFLDAVQPQYAIISVGSDNEYGHPAPEILLRLQHAYISVYRTDLHGTIVCTSDGQKMSFTMSKKNRKW